MKVDMILNRVLIIPMLLLSSCTDVGFESEKWKNWEEGEWNMHMRWDMVDDLMSNYLHKGMEVDEVEDLIGKAPFTTIRNEEIARYGLGPCRSGIDYGTLEIKYDQGKLSSFEKRCN